MSLAQYFRMTGGKTAALIEGALEVGATLGTKDVGQIECLARFGRSFGLAFQCRDDYLGIWGEPTLTGKPVASDLIQGKRSLPVVHALETASEDSATGGCLRAALEARDVPVVLETLEQLGTAQFVAARVEEHTAAALDALKRAHVDNVHGDAIRDIARYALGRES